MRRIISHFCNALILKASQSRKKWRLSFCDIFFNSGDSKFSYFSNLATDEDTGCASTVVRHKIKNTSANNEAMRLKLGRDVALYKIYLIVHILVLLWQHALFHFPSSSKLNIAICESGGQNWCYLRRMPDPPSTGSPLKPDF